MNIADKKDEAEAENEGPFYPKRARNLTIVTYCSCFMIINFCSSINIVSVNYVV